MKGLVKNLLNKAGYEVKKLSTTKHFPSAHRMDDALCRIKKLGIAPKCIVDVGAAEGKWTQKAMHYWPDAHYELIEPIKEQVPTLDNLVAEHDNVNYHTVVAGAELGSVPFSVSEDLDGSGVYGSQAANVRELPILTIDDIVAQRQGPYLIKLDTHGYEVPILKGANKALKDTEALIVEVYGFYVSPTGLLFHQLSVWLEEKGFRLYDIVDVMRRQNDLAFWQADAVYLKADHKIFQDNAYH